MLKPRYNKTLYEWTEDVIKPRLLLGKMCQGRVRVAEEDMKKAFENKYGEKRQAKIICWSKEDLRAAERQWDEAARATPSSIALPAVRPTHGWPRPPD